MLPGVEGGEDSGSNPMIRERRSVECCRRTAKARKLWKMASWSSRFGSLWSFMWEESWTGTAEPQQKIVLTTEGVDILALLSRVFESNLCLKSFIWREV